MTDETESVPRAVDRRKKRTRRYLLEAALAVLQQKGYDEMMTDEITEYADIGRRTFYNHFINKRECVIEALTGQFVRYAEQVAATMPEVGPGRDEARVLAAMASRVFLAIAEDPLTARLVHHPKILSEAIEESQRDYITTNLILGLESNRLHPVFPLESMAPILTWGFVGLVIAAIERGTQEADSLVWARFVLYNFGLGEMEIADLTRELEP